MGSPKFGTPAHPSRFILLTAIFCSKKSRRGCFLPLEHLVMDEDKREVEVKIGRERVCSSKLTLETTDMLTACLHSL